jgi:uncharacterized protein with NRDE domain
MCLLVLAWQCHPRYRLVVAANRDEYHARESAPLAPWPPPGRLLGGRDLRAQGAWLALERGRRFGVVTNFRELQPPQGSAPSRGALIPQYLTTEARADSGSPRGFFAALEPHARAYSGFNLLLADHDSLWYGSNRATPFARALAPGVYGLSNELLDTPWPKLERTRARFAAWLRADAATPAGLFALLADRTPAPQAALQNTGGLPREWARALSAPFVLHPEYGTRCSTVLLLAPDGRLHLEEHRFDSRGESAGETTFALGADEWP